MKPEIKEMWIAALESGEYRQGMNRLRIGNAFCCLGVLCDLYRKATGLGEWKPSHSDIPALKETMLFMDGRGYEETVQPSESVTVWAGLKNSKEMEYNTFPLMNDKQGASFPEIARYIKVNL